MSNAYKDWVRDRDLDRKETLVSLRYWRDLAECNCDSKLPIGSCERCDLDRIIEHLVKTEGWED